MIASLDRVLLFDSVFSPLRSSSSATTTTTMPTEVLIEIQVSNFINDFFFADHCGEMTKNTKTKTKLPETMPLLSEEVAREARFRVPADAQKVGSGKQTKTVAGAPPLPPPITMQRWPTFPPPSPSASKGISHINPTCSSHSISISNINSNSNSFSNSNSNIKGNPLRVMKPASKPPKPPLEGSSRLTRSVSDTSFVKKKRSSSRSRRNNKVSGTTSNNASLWSMLITILFFGMMLLQGMLPVGHGPHEVKLGGVADLDTTKFVFARRLQIKFEIPPSSQFLTRQTGINVKARRVVKQQ